MTVTRPDLDDAALRAAYDAWRLIADGLAAMEAQSERQAKGCSEAGMDLASSIASSQARGIHFAGAWVRGLIEGADRAE